MDDDRRTRSDFHPTTQDGVREAINGKSLNDDYGGKYATNGYSSSEIPERRNSRRRQIKYLC